MSITPYSYTTVRLNSASAYLWPVVISKIEGLNLVDKRAFDLGCGNGATANMLYAHGFAVSGVDPSESGVAIANQKFPYLRIEHGSTDDDLAAKYGKFPLVISLEVLSHCYSANRFVRTCFDLLEPGGTLIVSAPYHSYLKNLALSIANRWDFHHKSVSDGEHIKFFSVATLRGLLEINGLKDIRFFRVGRIPIFAKSMMAIARGPLI